jgi:hypothetical protein
VTYDNRHGHTHKMKWQKWKQIHLHHTIANTDILGSNKRNEILPLHQEVANRLEAHFTNKQVSSTRQTYKVKSAPFFKNECAYVKSNKGAGHRTTP